LAALADRLEAIVDMVGRAVAWLVLAVVFLLFLQNPLREFIGRGQFLANDMGQLSHATVFMLGVAYAWRCDRQVRVDLVYGRLSARAKATVNLLGTLFLLLPWVALVAWDAVPSAWQSWQLLEHFPESGSPGFFVMKTVVAAFALLLAMQALAVVLRSLATLAGRSAAE